MKNVYRNGNNVFQSNDLINLRYSYEYKMFRLVFQDILNEKNNNPEMKGYSNWSPLKIFLMLYFQFLSLKLFDILVQ